MAHRIPIHWDRLLRFVPEHVPALYKVESDGLPDPATLVLAGTGAEGKAVRSFLAHLLHAACRRVGELETSLAACEVDKSAMDKALTQVPVPKASPAITEVQAIEDEALKALLAAKERLPQLEADLKKAHTKATVYYSSWKSLERHVNGKAKQLPSDEMKLAEAVTSLVEKGYIQDIEPGGQIPIEVMCSMVAGVAEKLPSTEAISFNAGDHVLEPVLALGDPYPTEFRLHANADGVVHTYFRAGTDTTGPIKAVPAAEVSNYAELEQINAVLDSQLKAAQKELETLQPLKIGAVTYQILRREMSDSKPLTLKVRETDADGGVRECVLIEYTELVQACTERKNWQDTAAQHARNEAFYRDLLDQIAGALNDPDVFKSDDGSVQQEPIRLKLPEMVAALNTKSSEALSLLAHNVVLLDTFRSGVRAITDPMEGQDAVLLEMLHRMKHRALYTGNGTHFQAQSTEMRNGVLYRVTGLYYDGHDYEPVDLVAAERSTITASETNPPTVIELAFQGLLDRITNPTQQEPLEDCHTLSEGTLHLRAEFSAGQVLERRWDGFDFAVLTVPQAIVPKQELGNHMMGSAYMVETNTLYLLAAWKGEHPTNWKLDADFDLRPQIINRER